MRIAFFVGSFPEISETFILYQITGLIDLGHDVQIFSEYHPKQTAVVHEYVHTYHLLDKTFYLDDHIPAASGTWELPVWPVDGETWIPGDSLPVSNKQRIEDALPHLVNNISKYPHIIFKILDQELYGYQAKSLSSLYRLSALAQFAGNFDVAHCHFGPTGNKFRFVKELWKIPFIVTFHGYDFSSFPVIHGETIYKDLFSIADIVTVNSQYAGNRLIQLGCREDHIVQLNVGIKIKNFEYSERELNSEQAINVLTVGRLVEKKGIEYAIRAISTLITDFPTLKYEIIGDGPLEKQLKKLVQDCGIENHVIFHGAQNSGFVLKKMKEAHIFCLPSITAHTGDQEGTPVVLMEAQATGLPVVSTQHSGIPEVIINSKSGILVQEKSVIDISSALKTLLTNSLLIQKFGEFGRIKMENNHDLDKLNQDLVSIYKNAIANNITKNEDQ
jgi:colanic acid/amylovoran biosynthesis glycosyltransferase